MSFAGLLNWYSRILDLPVYILHTQLYSMYQYTIFLDTQLYQCCLSVYVYASR